MEAQMLNPIEPQQGLEESTVISFLKAIEVHLPNIRMGNRNTLSKVIQVTSAVLANGSLEPKLQRSIMQIQRLLYLIQEEQDEAKRERCVRGVEECIQLAHQLMLAGIDSNDSTQVVGVTSSLPARPAKEPDLRRIASELTLLASEFDHYKNRILQAVPTLHERLLHLNETASALFSVADDLEREPLTPLVDACRRRVEETARDHGKQVEFKVVGEEARIDRSLIQRVASGIEAMIENAVAHGIEPSAVRAARSKGMSGQVTLRVRERQGRVEFRISDDGNGINRQAVYEAAVAKGMLRRDQFLTDSQMVGLSVKLGTHLHFLNQIATELGGDFKIHSVEGKGTIINLRLPLGWAVVDGFLARVGHKRVLLSQNDVIEISHQHPGEDAEIVYLGEVFDESAEAPEGRVFIKMKTELGRKFYLSADELIGRRRVVPGTIKDSRWGDSRSLRSALLETGERTILVETDDLVGNN